MGHQLVKKDIDTGYSDWLNSITIRKALFKKKSFNTPFFPDLNQKVYILYNSERIHVQEVYDLFNWIMGLKMAFLEE